MAFGFGPGSAMIKSVQSNRKQLAKNRSLKDSYGQYKTAQDSNTPNFKKISEKELEGFKKKFQEKKKKEDRQNIVLLGAVFLILLIGLYWLMF